MNPYRAFEHKIRWNKDCYCIWIILLGLLPGIGLGQSTGSCFNAGFETGDTEGYETYTGFIDGDGTVVIETPEIDNGQHAIMHISDGNDPIAANACDSNSVLPVVPPGAGEYTMRLGNSATGAKAARVLLQFNVTPDLSFFLLKYAVVLNDPSHEEFEQPRFELRILDDEGSILPCGEYSVRADEGIPNFEDCSGGWRVRPWTTAGFELQSYIGQDIQIEILTTDCSQGGHAGYAYFDGSCSPLEIELNGYCPGTSSASLNVTEGFETYEWSTGAATNSIEISNPVEGDIYSVTVTSATGCSLVLTDTIPEIPEIIIPELNPISDTTICLGNEIVVTPDGQNIIDIYSPTLDQTDSTFVLSPDTTTTFLFTASDISSCVTDSIAVVITVDTLSDAVDITDIIVDSISCFDITDGSIEITSNADSILWNTGEESNIIDELPEGAYVVQMFDEFGCWVTQEFELIAPEPLVVDSLAFEHVNCFEGNDGSLFILPLGGTPPYSYNNSPASTFFEQNTLTAGNYSFLIEDQNGCEIEENILITQPEEIVLTLSQDSVVCFGETNGQATVAASGGVSPFEVNWNDANQQQTFAASNLSSGNYFATVIDSNGCEAIGQIMVEEPALLSITNLEVEHASCFGGSDGTLTVYSIGGNGNYSYIWNDSGSQNSQMATNLSAGGYNVTVTDFKGCSTEGTAFVNEPAPLELTMFQDSVSCNNGGDGIASVIAIGGNGGYTYSWLGADGNNSAVNSLNAGNYVVTVVDVEGCIEVDSITVLEPAPLMMQVISQTAPDCPNNLPAETIIDVTGGNGNYEYEWTTADQFDTVRSLVQAFFPVTITDAKGCTLIEEVEVKGLIFDIEAASDFIADDNAICFGNELSLQIIASPPAKSIQWINTPFDTCSQCFNIRLRPERTTTYRAIIEHQNECISEVAFRVVVDRKTCEQYIPNAFSPNGDGFNDYFNVPSSKAGVKIASMEIYNRWGGLVFEEKDLPIQEGPIGWNGEINGEMAMDGVYIYQITIENFDGTSSYYKGEVHLLK